MGLRTLPLALFGQPNTRILAAASKDPLFFSQDGPLQIARPVPFLDDRAPRLNEAQVDYAIKTIRELLEEVPIFGICLGHQLLALACGAETFKLKFGHRGANQPVQNLETGSVEITAQNHGFAVKEETLPETLRITHRNLNDNTIAGLAHRDLPAFSVQYHPEASSGPHDSNYLFKEFRSLMDRQVS